MSLADRISLSPTASDVSRLNAWFDQKCGESGIEKTLAADLKLCLNEVVANLISYGFKDTLNPSTTVEISLELGCASATVTDNGSYFDIREWQLPKGRDLMTCDPGGFGIALIRERATEIGYTRLGEFNRLTIACKGTSP
jgi:sigma-B regulation protein RsbU (phosphoserine phosphatase)